jgi:hypothetical protein
MNNHLIKAVEILKDRYKHEIYEGDWMYNLRGWTINISSEDDNTYDVVAYRAKDNVTDWSEYIELPSYPVQWELTYER